MEPHPTNLVTNTRQLLDEGTVDSHLFQNTYSQLSQLTFDDEDSLANRVGPLSQPQVYQLRSQILAYKHLIRNIPIPTSLTVPTIHSNIWVNEREKLTQKAVAFYRDKVEKEIELKSMITGNLKNPINQGSENEEITRLMIERRQNEIRRQLEKNGLADSTRLRLQIENKFLQPNVRNVYHRVLKRVVDGYELDKKSLKVFESQLLDRNFYRREKLQRNREAGNRVDKVENQMKTDHEKRKKRKHKDLLEMMRSHKEEFNDFHRKREKERRKIVNQAKDIYEKKKKSEDDLESKQTKLRLELIKQKDYTKYFEELKKVKNSKINELFSQTNKFLKELGAKVLIQKGDQDDKDEEYNQNEVKDDIANAFENANLIYYNLTHTVKEEITKQPSILSGGDLKKYQLQGLQWLVSLYNNRLNGILADEMGLGKTIQTISLLAYLYEFKKNYGPFLIVVPLATISNWMAEFDKWAPAIKRILYRGNPATRTEILKQMKTTKWNVCITTYDFILKDRQKLSKYNWKYIVIDEGHKMKNAKSKFAGVLGTQYQSDHRLLLTGTPLQNNLGELWALLNFLLPKVFSSCDDFQKWFSIALSKQTGGQQIELSEEEQLLIINRLHHVLRPFLLRRVKKQVAKELPEKKEFVIKVEMSAWQKLIYEKLDKKIDRKLTENGESSNSYQDKATALNNLVMQLRKCCNHPYMFLDGYDLDDMIFRSSGKFELIDRILPKLKEYGHRVLIFTQMTHLMDIMANYFKYKHIEYLRLDGTTKERGELIDKFNQQNSRYDIFLLSTRAGGLGLNLQSADTVIIFDSDWNPQMDLQAQDRAHRIGQEKEVIVLRFICANTIEEKIYSRAIGKKNLDQILIQGGMYNLNSSETERREKIEDILKKTGTHQTVKEQIYNDEIINRFLARSLEEYERFSIMDAERNGISLGNNMESDEDIYGKEDGEEDEMVINSRLMTEDEIPKWFVQSTKKTEQKKEYGRGNRITNKVNYCYDFIDQQLDKIMLRSEEAEDSLQESKSRVRKGKKKKNEADRMEGDPENEPYEENPQRQ